MIRLAFYFAIGAIFHLIFVGSQFDFTSAWTWLWLFGWPFMLFVTFWAVALIVLAIILIVIGAAALVGRA